MLLNEQQQQQKIRNDLLSIFQIINLVNQQILATLETDQPMKLDKVEKISKNILYTQTTEIDQKIIKFFALFCPEAKDLRELVSFLKITNELNRISSHQRAFIKDFPKCLVPEVEQQLIIDNMISLQKSALSALNTTLEMVCLEDKALIEEYFKKVLLEESRNDDLYKVFEKSILQEIDKNLKLANNYQEVLAVGRRVEKIADRALSIAGLLNYAKLGGKLHAIENKTA